MDLPRWQLGVPIDEEHTRFWAILFYRRQGFLKNLKATISYWGWASWVHNGKFYPAYKGFTGQDRRAAENGAYGSEYYSISDKGILAWRKWSLAHARRPESESVIAKRGNGAASSESTTRESTTSPTPVEIGQSQ